MDKRAIDRLLLFTVFFIVSCLVSCTSPLSPPELAQLKKGELFWKWKSPYGTYDIHYVEKGKGAQHILLIHGFGANTYTWHYLIDDLAQAGYHVWSLDLLGFGLSDKPQNVSYGLDLFNAQITDFMKVHHMDQVSLIGNSMGGGLALAQTVANPQKVKTLILIDALGYPLTLPFPLMVSKFLGQAIKPFQGRFMVRHILEQVMFDSRKITEEQIEAYTVPLSTPGGSDAFLATLRGFDPQQLVELSGHYKEIRIPILIIWGEEDRWIPLSHLEQFGQNFAQAKKVVIPQCGHIPHEECPDQVANVILRFLGETYALR